MENLDEWSTSLDDGQQQRDEIFPNLEWLVIKDCPRLRFNPYFPGSATCDMETCSALIPSQVKFVGGSHETLRIMKISNCGMSSSSLEFLQDTVNLEHLSISNCSDLTVLPETIRGCSSLKKLEIVECWNFSELPECLGQLRSLTRLTIHAAKLESLPQSIKCLTNLEILNLNTCNYKIRERCSLSGEDKDKIKHVRHVHISEERCRNHCLNFSRNMTSQKASSPRTRPTMTSTCEVGYKDSLVLCLFTCMTGHQDRGHQGTFLCWHEQDQKSRRLQGCQGRCWHRQVLDHSYNDATV